MKNLKTYETFKDDDYDNVYLIKSKDNDDIRMEVFCKGDRYVGYKNVYWWQSPLWEKGEKISKVDIKIYLDMFINHPGGDSKFYIVNKFYDDVEKYNL